MIPLEAIPLMLHPFPQWVLWCYVDRRGTDKKPYKQPINPKTLGSAGVAWPNTWGTIECTYASYLREKPRGIQGLGFVLTPTDPIVAIDLDDCIECSCLSPYATEIIQTLASYSEVSPSGKGLRIFVSCPQYEQNHKAPSIEIYSSRRYVTVTGQHIAGTPSEIAEVTQDQLSELLPATPPTQSPATYEKREWSVEDVQLWERIFKHDKYGTAHHSRFYGDISADGGDESLTVIRLLNTLARWTYCDGHRMRRMIEMTQLSQDKWRDIRPAGDWLEHQIINVIAYVSGKKGRT